MGGDNQYRYYGQHQLPLLRRIVFLRGLGLGLEVIRDLLRAGTLEDPIRLQAILHEHAALTRREIDTQREQLADIERATPCSNTTADSMKPPTPLNQSRGGRQASPEIPRGVVAPSIA